MNIRDIARLANVTPGTVSKVLNNYPDISEATRQHVLQIIKENQYTTKNGRAESSNRLLHHVLDLVSENVYNWVSETNAEPAFRALSQRRLYCFILSG